MSDRARAFPPGFRWGAATSAHQVEGDNHGNDWWRFEQAHGLSSGAACRHWQQFDADFARAEADGHAMHRLSFEWSRIEPARGRRDADAIAHYHAVLASLKRHGLTPLVTLHHFTLPLWVADAGGWESRATLDAFDAFVRFCAREYGGEVDWWCTVNEPEVYAFRAYSEGVWPPAVRDDRRALHVIANLLEAHARAFRILRDEDRVDADGDGHAVRASFAKHLVQLVPANPWNPLDRLRAAIEDRVFNRAVMEAAVTGDIDLGIPGVARVRRRVPELAGSLDYFALNYYTRWGVRALGKPPHVARKDAPLTDLGWEIWPQGLALAARRAAQFAAPVLVTEHGFADAADRLRPRALVASLLALQRAIASGTPVIGYLHWSLLDNFEWADNWRARFGLYQVDETAPDCPRTRTKSAELFAQVAKANAITDDVLHEVGIVD
ncbi:MAG TPA: family 1 glycosylhydrolase [Candidatus Eisenbacteria bacterium]|nr:family 1 glycosylhydrolase [Candidatus Eisenbacteria bacterium]